MGWGGVGWDGVGWGWVGGSGGGWGGGGVDKQKALAFHPAPQGYG